MTDSAPTNDVIIPEVVVPDLNKHNYFIRVHKSAFELDKCKLHSYLAEISDVVCSVEHPKHDGPEGTHCHLFVWGCTKVAKNIRNGIVSRINKGQEKITNGLYSVKESHNGRSIDEGCVVYMSKGKYAPAFLHGRTMEWYEKLRSQWVSKPSDNDKTEVVVGKVVKVTEFDAFCMIQDELYKDGWQPVMGEDNFNLAMRKIIDVRKKLLHRVTGPKQMNDLLYGLYNDEYVQDSCFRNHYKNIFG